MEKAIWIAGERKKVQEGSWRDVIALRIAAMLIGALAISGVSASRAQQASAGLQAHPFKLVQQGGSAGLLSTNSGVAITKSARNLRKVPGATGEISFDGVPSGGWATSDSNGAVGPTQYVQIVNTNFAVFEKSSGAMLYGPVAINTIWQPMGGTCAQHNSGDPLVTYDRLAGVWVFAQRVAPTNGPYFMCFALSQTSDATGAYKFFVFSLPNNYPDYPKIGVWPDAYYITYNELLPQSNWAFYQTQICAYDRESMLSGAQSTSQCVGLPPSGQQSSLLPSDLDGTTPPPAGAPNILVNLGKTQLNVWTMHVDFSNPSNTQLKGPMGVPVQAYTEACNGGTCVPQGGTTQKLDSIGDRLMYRLAYRNFGDHQSLVVNHSISTTTGAAAVRWYELRIVNDRPLLYQQGTFAPDSNSRWVGSVAMDHAGDIGLGYSLSSASVHPSIAFTGRVPTDPLGAMEAETLLVNGQGSAVGTYRWGDYTSLTPDPSDDCTFWYTNQFYERSGNGTWGTLIGSFKFPSCTND